MLLYDENLQQLNVAELKAELLDVTDVADISEDELELQLSEYYSNSLALDTAQYQLQVIVSPSILGIAEFSFSGIGRRILGKIKDFICRLLNPDSGIPDLIDAIVDAIASIIPGGIIFKGVVKKVVKFIISQGIGAFCRFA